MTPCSNQFYGTKNDEMIDDVMMKVHAKDKLTMSKLLLQIWS